MTDQLVIFFTVNNERQPEDHKSNPLQCRYCSIKVAELNTWWSQGVTIPKFIFNAIVAKQMAIFVKSGSTYHLTTTCV